MVTEMKLLRYTHEGREAFGFLRKDTVYELRGDLLGEYEATGAALPLTALTLLPPINPTKAVCVGLNYRDHAEEMNLEIPDEPVLFLKPSTALLPPGGTIRWPRLSSQIDYEGELAIVIGKTAHEVPPERAKEYILGYTCANDVTARDLQPGHGQWTLAKGFDTFLPLGPWVETMLDPGALEIETLLDGRVMQRSNTRHLIFDPLFLLSYVSQVMTLLPGDVILTGTPSGVGPMVHGSQVEIRIEGIGSLQNTLE